MVGLSAVFPALVLGLAALLPFGVPADSLVQLPAIGRAAPPAATGPAVQEHQHQTPACDPHEGRWYWQLPQRVMTEIGVREGMVIADVGAGDGYFTLRLARRVGPAGRIYATDIDESALQTLRRACQSANLENVSIILGSPDDPKLPPATSDVALMVNVINLVKDPVRFLERVKAGLKPEGRLAIVQWDAEKMDSEMPPTWDPKNRAQFLPQAVLGPLHQAGFDVIGVKTFLPMQMIYIARPAVAGR